MDTKAANKGAIRRLRRFHRFGTDNRALKHSGGKRAVRGGKDRGTKVKGLVDWDDRLRGGAIGSTSDFGSENPGSSPGPGANISGEW